MMSPLVFLDTETDGLGPQRRAYEIAMIHRDEQGQRETSFFVALSLSAADPFALNVGRFWDRHPQGRALSGKTATPARVYSTHDAARTVMEWTFGAHIVGAVPNFDTELLGRLLRHEGYLPSWSHHLIDVEAMALGYLNGANVWTGPVVPPWKSDDLAALCGVEPTPEGERHTALGDARWVMRWYDAMAGTP